MSLEPLTCRYVFSPKEYQHAMQCFWQHSWLKWLLLVLLVPFGMQVYAEFFPDPNSPPITFGSVFFDFLPGVIFLIFVGLFLKYGGQFYFRRTAHCNQEMIYTLREDGVHVKNPLSESEMKWPIYARTTESTYGFSLFHQGKRMFNWLPKDGFDSTESIDLCRELLRRMIKDAKQLKKPV
jgi:hypothetical protein